MSQKTADPARRGARPRGGAGTARDARGAASPCERTALLKRHAAANPHDVGYINEELFRCAHPSTRFSDLVAWLAKEPRGPLRLPGLAGFYELDRETFELLCRELSGSGDDRVLTALGFILGGMGGRDPEKLFEMMQKKEITGIPLLGAVWAAGMAGRRIPDRITPIVLRYAGSKDRYTRNMAIRVAIEQLHGSKGTVARMLRLAGSDDETRVWMAQCVSSSRMDPEAAFRLLEKCSRIEDERHLGAMASHVGHMAAMFPVECLDILKEWMKRFGPAARDHRTCWIAEQIGASKRADFEKIEGFFLGWINAECRKDRSGNRAAYRFLEFSLPDLIHDVYKCRQHEFLSLVKKIDYENSNKKDVIVRIIETFFSESYERIKGPISDECGDLLADIAIHHGLDRAFRADRPSPTMETLALVQDIRLDKKIVDPARARKNLGEFPNVARFLTRAKIHNLIDTDKSHPLVRLLDKSGTTRSRFKTFEKMAADARGGYRDRLIQSLIGEHRPWILLDDLDRILGAIKPGEAAGTRHMLLGGGFYEASVQLGMYARFKKRNCRPQLDPVLYENARQSKRADLRAKIRGTDCYFELYLPAGPRRRDLEYIRRARRTGTGKIGARVRRKIDSLLEAAARLDSPLILVMDSRHLGAPDLEVRDLLEGSLQLAPRAAGTRAPRGPRTTRASHSFNRETAHGSVLSAVVLLRSVIDVRTLRVRMEGDIYENPGARSPLSGEMVQDLREVLFNDAGKV